MKIDKVFLESRGFNIVGNNSDKDNFKNIETSDHLINKKGSNKSENFQISSNMMKEKNTFFKIIENIVDFSDTTMAIVMCFVAVITFFELISRRFFHKPTIWTYDISVYALIWYTFMVAGKTLRDKHHIRVDIFVNMLSEKDQIPIDIITYLACFIFSSLLSFFTFALCKESYYFQERTISLLATPVWLIQLGMVIGSILLVLQSLILLFEKIKEWKKVGFKTFGKRTNENPYILIGFSFTLFLLGLFLFKVNTGLAMIISVFGLLFVGVPVFVSLGIIGTIGLYVMMGFQYGLPQIAIIAQASTQSYTLLAIPLFILAGNILVKGDIGHELYDFCVKWIGYLPGGIAIATIIACAIFASISGSSVATAAIIGVVAIPELRRYGYDLNLSLGILAAGGTLGILIPPSNSMIIYSTITEESTGALFMGGFIPGIIVAIIFSIYAYLYCIKTKKFMQIERFPLKIKINTTIKSIWGLLTPVVILVSIYTGFCTPTEAAGLAVSYALVVSIIRGKVKFSDIVGVSKSGNGSAGMIMMIVVGAMILGNAITIMQIPQKIINLISSSNLSTGAILVIISIVYIILGMFLEVVSIMYITIPIVYPLIKSLGFNGIWFGVFITLLMEMALISPPVGLNMYVIQGIAKEPMIDVIKGVWPFMVLLLVGLIILYFFPILALWLPGTMGYGGV